jgi:Rsm1-like
MAFVQSSTQVQSLLAVMASAEAEPHINEDTGSDISTEEQPIPAVSRPLEPSSTAILTSLFGWSLLPSVPPSLPSTTCSPSCSRASSVTPREISVSPSVSQTPRRRSGLGSATQMTPSHPVSFDTSIAWSPRGSVAPERRRDTSLLHCPLCLRRLGLWAAGSVPRTSRATEDNPSSAPPRKTRQIDLLREHRPYCPYVVRSTTVPSLPIPSTNAMHKRVPSSTPSFTSLLSLSSNSQAQMDAPQPSAVEGWRAVLMIVLRYRMGQWQRRKMSESITNHVDGEPDASQAQSAEAPARTADINEESWVEVDPVEAMVEGVKSRGVRGRYGYEMDRTMRLTKLRLGQGTELLRYIKGLLG